MVALEVLLLLIRALERRAALRIVVVQGLVRLSLDVAAAAATAAPRDTAGWRRAAVAEARRALRSAAQQALGYLHGALSDGILDVFSEEWEACTAPLVDLREACNSL